MRSKVDLLDHDASGVGFITRLGSPGSREVVDRALEALRRIGHRGGVDADGRSGDGAGLLTTIPDRFLREAARAVGIELPPVFAVGMIFLPEQKKIARDVISKLAQGCSFHCLGWREVPTDPSVIGPQALRSLRRSSNASLSLLDVRVRLDLVQLAKVQRSDSTKCYRQRRSAQDSADFESVLFRFRKQAEELAPIRTYFCSLSSRTIATKDC
jgi:glutamate synthase domain-containing protein 1